MAKTTSKAPKDPNEKARLDQDLQFTTVYAPPFYPGKMRGPGRWFPLLAHLEPLGVLWTNDKDGLGFLPTSDAGIQRTPEFAQAFARARALNLTATEVFDSWSDRVGLGLSAGPVETGDLDTLR